MSDDPYQRAHAVLYAWSRSITDGDIDALVALFAPDALFVATAPSPLRGRAAITSYYLAAPAGLRAWAELNAVARDGVRLVVVAAVAFEVPHVGRRDGTLTMAIGPAADGQDQITLYHAALGG
jgi:hypothetical protein